MKWLALRELVVCQGRQMTVDAVVLVRSEKMIRVLIAKRKEKFL